jgi:hypothetical protein
MWWPRLRSSCMLQVRRYATGNGRLWVAFSFHLGRVHDNTPRTVPAPVGWWLEWHRKLKVGLIAGLCKMLSSCVRRDGWDGLHACA